ncbi:MAG TPA: hypothetical protein VF698_04110 [Thermoanaerobaculia bacterium]
MSENRTPRFEIHIRPMFRLLDRDHMLAILGGRAFDLHDYDAVVNHAEAIYAHLQDNMPTINTGGLWPDEWKALFRRWIDEKCPRLEQPAGGVYTAVTNGKLVVLKASIENPRPDDRAWFERFNPNDAPREYWLYREPGSAASIASVTPVVVQERFAYTAGVDRVIVVDANGPQTVPITR